MWSGPIWKQWNHGSTLQFKRDQPDAFNHAGIFINTRFYVFTALNCEGNSHFHCIYEYPEMLMLGWLYPDKVVLQY